MLWFTCQRRQEILASVVGGTYPDTHVVARWNVLTADSAPPGPASRQNVGPPASRCHFLDAGGLLDRSFWAIWHGGQTKDSF